MDKKLKNNIYFNKKKYFENLRRFLISRKKLIDLKHLIWLSKVKSNFCLYNLSAVSHFSQTNY